MIHHKHENSWIITCTLCGDECVATLVLPTNKRTIMLAGSCPRCFTVGRKSTIIFEFFRTFVTQKEWESLMMVENLPVAKSSLGGSDGEE